MVGEAKYSTTCLSICAYTKILSYVMDFNPSTRGWGEEKTTPRSRGSNWLYASIRKNVPRC
jgi:hypothetical protein